MKFISGLSSLLLIIQCWAQPLLNFDKQYNQLQKVGMATLSSFAIANITVSAIGLSSENASNKAFHQMNIGWNSVNIILGASGLRQAYRTKPFTNDVQALKAGEKMETIFLVNAALDMAYIAGGAWIKETRYRNSAQWNQLTGWGNAVMYNGVFLLVFDGMMYALHRNNNEKLWQKLQTTQIGFSPNGFQCIVQF
ncbi:MAG: hypothetical protein MUE96_03920 [Bacteroidia bacterium]|jgi:hypothetical protein|nr:hypothetical protein [Bacteroidia bacterium]